ncbi:hypothetical protein [Sphingobium sp. Z007]|uniref:hypothetical protein n=1 Tax=Sphingobium sp. Z007 TaxID=627495 RepID=UPI000B4980EA|nr:hypothetical protein [Sphingobium sp. Z007]
MFINDSVIGKDERWLFASQILYAFRNNVPEHFLAGFLYQLGKTQKILIMCVQIDGTLGLLPPHNREGNDLVLRLAAPEWYSPMEAIQVVEHHPVSWQFNCVETAIDLPLHPSICVTNHTSYTVDISVKAF